MAAYDDGVIEMRVATKSLHQQPRALKGELEGMKRRIQYKREIKTRKRNTYPDIHRCWLIEIKAVSRIG